MGFCLFPEPDNSLAESPEVDDSQKTFSQKSCFSQESSEYCPSQMSQEEEEQNTKRLKQLIQTFARTAQISQFYFTTDFASLALSTKKRRLKSVRQVIHKICELIAGNQKEDFEEMLFSQGTMWQLQPDTLLSKLLQKVAEAFSDSPTPAIKKHVLSVVAPYVSLEVLQQFIPGLSRYYFLTARSFQPATAFEDTAPHMRQRYDRKKVTSFVTFITSPHVIQDLPFGVKKVKASDGRIETIPNVIRQMISTRIIQQYTKFLTENNQADLMLSKSTLLRILNKCTATTRKCMLGLDYFSYESSEAFDSISNIVETVEKYLCDQDWLSSTKTKLKDARSYLKSDYRIHVKLSSRSADHCATFSLSDPRDSHFAAPCIDHAHDLVCPQCTNIDTVLRDIHQKLSDAPFPTPTEKSITQYLFDQARNNIEEYKRHVLRTAHQDTAREDVMKNLLANEIYITVDFSMKWLGIAGR